MIKIMISVTFITNDLRDNMITASQVFVVVTLFEALRFSSHQDAKEYRGHCQASVVTKVYPELETTYHQLFMPDNSPCTESAS